MKKLGVFAHLFSYMGRFKITMVLSIILAAVAAVLNLSAFVCVGWFVCHVSLSI